MLFHDIHLDLTYMGPGTLTIVDVSLLAGVGSNVGEWTVPEPPALALLGAGLVALSFLARRGRKRRRASAGVVNPV